jgi:ribosomal 50S subunit-recycling heat shock protein
MKKYLVLALVLSALGFFAGSSAKVWGITAQDISSNSALTTIIAKVMDIDYDLRRVTLETTEGQRMKFKVGKEAKNFKQVKVGDMVQIQYYQSIAWEILPPGQKVKPTASTTATMTTAPKGEKPDVDTVEVTQVAGTIESIDKANAMVVLKGPEGKPMPLKVRYPDKLSSVKVGDQVSATITEAWAISVEPAPKK